jgi:hypothetical protein
MLTNIIISSFYKILRIIGVNIDLVYELLHRYSAFIRHCRKVEDVMSLDVHLQILPVE